MALLSQYPKRAGWCIATTYLSMVDYVSCGLVRRLTIGIIPLDLLATASGRWNTSGSVENCEASIEYD